MTNSEKSRGNRITKAEWEKRVGETSLLLGLGVTRGELVEHMRKTYQVSPAATDRYIAEARARWQKESEADRPHRREKQRRRIERTIRELLAQGRHADTFPFEKLLAVFDGHIDASGNVVNVQVNTAVGGGAAPAWFRQRLPELQATPQPLPPQLQAPAAQLAPLPAPAPEPTEPAQETPAPLPAMVPSDADHPSRWPPGLVPPGSMANRQH